MGVWNLIYSGETNEFVERIRTSGVRLDEPDLVGQVGPITYGKMRFRKGQETFIFMPRAEEEYHKHGFFDKEKWYQVRTLWLKNSEDTWDYYFRMDEIE